MQIKKIKGLTKMGNVNTVANKVLYDGSEDRWYRNFSLSLLFAAGLSFSGPGVCLERRGRLDGPA